MREEEEGEEEEENGEGEEVTASPPWPQTFDQNGPLSRLTTSSSTGTLKNKKVIKKAKKATHENARA